MAWERVGPACRRGGQPSPAPGAGPGAAQGAGAGSGEGAETVASLPTQAAAQGSGVSAAAAAARATPSAAAPGPGRAERGGVRRPPENAEVASPKRRHAGQRHGAHRGPDLLGPRPAPPLQEPGEGARGAARGCESGWGGLRPRGRGLCAAEPGAGPSRPGRSEESCGQRTRWSRWPAIPTPRRCRPALLPARERALPAPGTSRVWLRPPPPAGLGIAAASLPPPPVPKTRPLLRAPRTRRGDHKVRLGGEAPELGAVQSRCLRLGLQRNLLLLILAVSENSSSEQAVETGPGGLQYHDGGHGPSSGPSRGTPSVLGSSSVQAGCEAPKSLLPLAD